MRSNFEADEVKLGEEGKDAMNFIVTNVSETRYNVPKGKGMDMDVFGTKVEASASFSVRVIQSSPSRLSP